VARDYDIDVRRCIDEAIAALVLASHQIET
jgi:hypothetical protein